MNSACLDLIQLNSFTSLLDCYYKFQSSIKGSNNKTTTDKKIKWFINSRNIDNRIKQSIRVYKSLFAVVVSMHLGVYSLNIFLYV